MLIFRQLILLFAILFKNIPSSECEEYTKFDLLLDQILEPYQKHSISFQNNLYNSFQSSFQAIIFNDLLKKKSKQINSFPSLLSNDDTQPDPTLNINENLPARVLQASPTCLNGGIDVKTQVNSYFCDGKNVSKSFFDANKDRNYCITESIERQFCYCRFDFYGAECENYNTIYCTLDRISHPPNQCNRNDSKYYVYSYGQNDMPCYFANTKVPVNMLFRTKCSHTNPKWNYEGIKLEESLEYEPISLPDIFNSYAIDSPELKVSFETSLSLKLKFANWKRIFSPYVLENQLDNEKLLGLKDILFSINLESLSESFSLAGRYFYEIVVEGTTTYVNHEKATGIIEDLDYIEPLKKKSFGSFEYVFYLMIFCTILLLIFIVFKVRGAILAKNLRKDSYEPLIEMHPIHED